MLALPSGKKKNTIVSKKLDDAYKMRIDRVEASHGEASEAIAEYWTNLYIIKRDNLWRAKFNEGQFKDWLSDLSKESYGPSKTDFYDTMAAIDRLKRLGKTEEEIYPLLGHMTTAIKNDMKLLFEKNGKGKLLPEIQEQFDQEGITGAEFVDKVSTMSASDQRREVLGKRFKTSIYFMEDDVAYDEVNGRLLCNVLWENSEVGIVGKWTVMVTATEITEPRKHKKKEQYLPREVAEYIMQRFGISE